MNDLISKNDLYKKCESLHKRLVEGKITDKEAFRDLFNAVADAPPETDVKKVVHGYWKRHITKHDTLTGKCSVCGGCDELYLAHPQCCWCGAKMDGKAE